MNRKFALFLFCCLTALDSALAIPENVIDEGVFIITNELVNLIDGPSYGLDVYQRRRGLDNDEMCHVLIHAYEVLSPDVGEYAKCYIIDTFFQYPSSVPIPFLEKTFRSERNRMGYSALASYIRLLNYSGTALQTARDFLNTDFGSDWRFDSYTIGLLSSELKYGDQPPETRARIFTFLKKRALEDFKNPISTDRILCDAYETYSQSEERRQYLESVRENDNFSEKERNWALERIALLDSARNETRTMLATPQAVSTTPEVADTQDVQETPEQKNIVPEIPIEMENSEPKEKSPSMHPLAVSAIAIALLGIAGFLLGRRQRRG